MTGLKSRFENYFALQKELPLIEDEIADERNKAECAGTYQHNGYNRILMMSTGEIPFINQKMSRKEEIQQELNDLDAIVFSIPSSEIRTMIKVAYINGGKFKRWERVADHFGEDKSGRSYQLKVESYLNKYDYAAKISKITDFTKSG